MASPSRVIPTALVPPTSVCSMNKLEIKSYLRDVYGVKVEAVSTQVVLGESVANVCLDVATAVWPFLRHIVVVASCTRFGLPL